MGGGTCLEAQRSGGKIKYGRTSYKTNMQAFILITMYMYRWDVNSLIKKYVLWILRASLVKESLPGKDSDGKEFACNLRDLGSIPG